MPIWAPSPNNLGPSIGDPSALLTQLYTVTTPQPVVGFALPSTGFVLKITWFAQSLSAPTLYIQFNNDSSLSYNYQSIRGSVAVATSSQTLSSNSGVLGSLGSGGFFGSGDVVIPNFSNPSFQKEYVSRFYSNAASFLTAGIYGGHYIKAVTQTSVQHKLASGAMNFSVGSVFQLAIS